VVPVQWPDQPVITVSSSVTERFRGIDDTLLPVLVPRPFLANKSLAFVGEPLHYSVSVREKGATFAITGTRIAIDADGGEASAATDEVRTAVGEKNAEASFTRYGAAYLVTVECNADGDKRCADEKYATALLRSAQLVGGGRAAAGAPPAPRPLQSGGPIPVKADPNFKAEAPGALLPNSGNGVRAATVYAPGIRFPVSVKPAYLNSQVYGIGGHLGPQGGWSDARNYAYPWRDNFCEKRQYRTPMCPSGTGHQGVDIRPARPKNESGQFGVAAEPGRIAKIGSYSVTLAGDSGTQYNYLHLRNLKVSVGQRVTAGQVIGTISNNFAGTPTTVHLHFEIKQNRNGQGWVHVPPYSSLIAAYERM
jgi:murein DD-endopeptidase MepM/ murein hydrolase activator NlpD